jgi:hypothetical protein
MYGWNDLKKEITIENNRVICPFIYCQEKFDKMTKNGHNLRSNKKDIQKYLCKAHEIYISPSTFRYDNVLHNVLWKGDFNKLVESKNFKKRFNQFDHDNSEDALSWNVFRFLEKNDMIKEFLEKIFENPINTSEVIYWTYSQSQKVIWKPLNEARNIFELKPDKGSEPDIIIKTDNSLFFIEAKLKANNLTPKSKDVNKIANNPGKYITGGNKWFEKAFKTDYRKIVFDRKYELMRFWILGTWIAKHEDDPLDFYLINLVRKEKEKNIEEEFRRHIKENFNGGHKRIFKRMTWEDIYEYISKHALQNKNKTTILKYFENKTIGYKKEKDKKTAQEIRTLRKAFSIF